MRVSAPVPEQPALFDSPPTAVIPMAASRNYAGEFFERATIEMLGGRKCGIDSRCDVCPDIMLPDGTYLEVKSVGRGNAAMAYKARLTKDGAFVREAGARLWYALWHHVYAVQPGETLHSLRAGLAASAVSVTFVPFDRFARTMRQGGVMLLNKANGPRSRKLDGQRRGYGSDGYTHGYRTPLAKLQGERSRVVALPGPVLGHEVPPVRCYGLDRLPGHRA